MKNYNMATEVAKMAKMAEDGIYKADRSIIVGLTLAAEHIQKLDEEIVELKSQLNVPTEKKP